jgi:AI-2 transport protein TqsA
VPSQSAAPAPKAPPKSDPGVGQAPSPPYFGIVVLAALVIIGVGLRSSSSIVAPVFLVLTLVITVAPLRAFLVKHRWPSWLASVVSLLAIYALLLVILGSVVYAVVRLVDKLPDYAQAFNRIFDSLLALSTRLGYGQQQIQNLASSFQLSSLTAPAQALLGALSGGASLLILIITVVIFLAFDSGSIRERIAVIRETRPHIADGLVNFSSRVRKYWIVTTVFGLIVAIMDYVALLIIGVPLALTWGVLAFVTNYIPNIGFVIGVIPPALIALLDGGPGQALAVIIVFTLINVIVQTIIQPRFTGDAVGINGTVAFVSLIFWAYLLGALGALIAIPATLFLKSVLVDNSVPANWLNALISSDPKKETPAKQRQRRQLEVPPAERQSGRGRQS